MLLALERGTGRPPVYASSPVLFIAPPAETLFSTTEPLAADRQTSQALVVATVEGRPILSVADALCARTADRSGIWAYTPQPQRFRNRTVIAGGSELGIRVRNRDQIG